MKGTDGDHLDLTNETRETNNFSLDTSGASSHLPIPYAESPPSPPTCPLLDEVDERCAILIAAHYSLTSEKFERGETQAFEKLYGLVQPWLKKQLLSFAQYIEIEDVKQTVMMNVFNQACAVREANDLLHARNVEHAHLPPPVTMATEAKAASGENKRPHGQFDPRHGVPFRAWLHVALRNEALTQLRRRRSFNLNVALQRAAQCRDEADEHILVEELLERLTELEAHVMRRILQDRPYHLIAAEFHISIAKVSRIYHAALAKMRNRATGT